MVLEDAVLSRSKVTKPTYMPTLARRKVTYLMSKQSLKIFGHQPIPSVETRIDFNSYTNPTVERWLWRWRWGIAARLGLSPQKDQETWELSLSYLSLERVIIIKRKSGSHLRSLEGAGPASWLKSRLIKSYFSVQPVTLNCPLSTWFWSTCVTRGG